MCIEQTINTIGTRILNSRYILSTYRYYLVATTVNIRNTSINVLDKVIEKL